MNKQLEQLNITAKELADTIDKSNLGYINDANSLLDILNREWEELQEQGELMQSMIEKIRHQQVLTRERAQGLVDLLGKDSKNRI